jgi:hypothetical protein
MTRTWLRERSANLKLSRRFEFLRSSKRIRRSATLAAAARSQSLGSRGPLPFWRDPLNVTRLVMQVQAWPVIEFSNCAGLGPCYEDDHSTMINLSGAMPVDRYARVIGQTALPANVWPA